MGRQGQPLRRQLGFWDSTAIALGAIIGAGIFVVLGEAAAIAGAGLPVAALLAAAVAVFNGLSSAQLGTNYPWIGGTYEFAYHLLQPWVGFSAGLMYLLGNLTAGTTLSLTFAGYLQSLVPGVPPRAIAVGVAVVALAINLTGVQQSRRINNALVLFKLGVLAVFVGVGLAFLPEWQPLDLSTINLQHVLLAAALFFFAYTGFARPVTLAGEIRDPARNLPRSIMLALALSTLIYVAVAVVSLGLVGAPALSQSTAPLRTALASTGQAWAALLISLGALVATTDVLLTGIWALSRVALAMARRGDLPDFVGRMNGRGVPWAAMLVTGGITILLTAFLSFGPALAASSLSTLVYYGLTDWTSLHLSRRQRLYPPAVPLVGLAATAALIFSLPIQSLVIVAIVWAAGLLYFTLWRRYRRGGRY